MTGTPSPTWDPLGYNTPLPLRREFFPLGFPLEIQTNSRDVLEAAATSWPETQGAFTDPRLRMRVVVTGSANKQPPPPHYRAQANILTLAADQNHTAACDLEAGTALCWISSALAANQPHFRHHYLEGIVYSLLSCLRLTPVHASCVASGDRGVLLSAPPGTGKSCLAYACARAGLTFVSDDVAYLLRGDPGSRLVGRPHFLRLRPAALDMFPELKGTPVGADVGGEPILEIQLDKLEGLTAAPACEATAVLFLERRPNTPAAVTPIGPGRALALLVHDLPVIAESATRQQVASLESLTRRGAHRLSYSNLDEAVECVRKLLGQ